MKAIITNALKTYTFSIRIAISPFFSSFTTLSQLPNRNRTSKPYQIKQKTKQNNPIIQTRFFFFLFSIYLVELLERVGSARRPAINGWRRRRATTASLRRRRATAASRRQPARDGRSSAGCSALDSA